MDREPITIVEIDYDFCSRTFGQSPCTATLGGTSSNVGGTIQHKCHNTIKTCGDVDNFEQLTLTLRFCTADNQIPKGATYFPVVESVSAVSGTVNIAGQNPTMSALGRRASVNIRMQDFTYHDRLVDKYAGERITGAAQLDGIGYDPESRGTFFTKLRARWPYFAGRPLRVIEGYMDGGSLSVVSTRHFVISAFDGPGDRGTVTWEAEDVLALADKEKAQAPRASRGVLLEDIDEAATQLTLTPEGIGADYPTEGRAVIGTEIVSYSRAGDVVTLLQRAVAGSEIASHSADASFQEVLFFDGEGIADGLNRLLTEYTSIDPAFIPLSDWQAEVQRWAPQLKVDAHFTKPTAVSEIVSEFADLGFSIWWDAEAQRIGLKANRPVDGDTIHEFTDNAITAINQEAQDDRRLTDLVFFSVQEDPTKGKKQEENYNVVAVTVDQIATQPNRYGNRQIRKVFSRLLNKGNASAIRILSLRLLQRFNDAPVRVTMTVDAASARNVKLTDVARLKTQVITDPTGAEEFALFQVIKITPSARERGNTTEIVLEAYDFEGRYGFITPNDYPTYDLATDAQKQAGAFFVDETLTFPDGTGPYLLI